jgi:hypothetical protein
MTNTPCTPPVVVTREHREAWHEAQYGYVPEDGHPYRQWCTDGVDPHDTQARIAIMNRGARGYAAAESRGAARERAAIVTLIRRQVGHINTVTQATGRTSVLMQGRCLALNELDGCIERGAHPTPEAKP